MFKVGLSAQWTGGCCPLGVLRALKQGTAQIRAYTASGMKLVSPLVNLNLCVCAGSGSLPKGSGTGHQVVMPLRLGPAMETLPIGDKGKLLPAPVQSNLISYISALGLV